MIFPQYLVTQDSVAELERLFATLDFGPVVEAVAEARREGLLDDSEDDEDEDD